ncbi:uncharacterized protein LOC111350381 [Spodoptera litura]|uniref:Uncharacterized protein LOC111350381 n=1 Tax=Spodoptera litura TaxID=69820 RepID=A0A9J7DXT7_SPOLT|nr:uncharacterized protein LOC111350381 [Spodoptera litura]
MENEEEESSDNMEIIRTCESDLDKSLEPTIVKKSICQEVIKENVKKAAEKRKERGSEISDDDDFITVNRRRPKRLIRSISIETQNDKEVDGEKFNDLNNTTQPEVCVTSLENIPKQMALAKLLRSENITNVTRIKYKSFNKVIIQFKEKKDALKLLECEKFKDMGCRCQLIDELSLSYGVVKGVDLELLENELRNIFESDTEIISVKRLRRIDSEGKWIESESVRICFKSNHLPNYIYAYDCRLKVEPYVFPVTQCSGCWKFGHIIKYCPTKKKICPKCGGNHDNCDTTKISCLNCKGNHFVLDKNCPFFVKEKNIRKIMSTEQVTYRKALQILIEQQQQQRNTCLHNNLRTSMDTHLDSDAPATFSSILKKSVQNYAVSPNSKIIQNKSRDNPMQKKTTQQQEIPQEILSINNNNNNHGEKTTTKKKRYRNETLMEEDIDSYDSQNEEQNYQRDEHLLNKFDFKKFIIKLNRIFVSDKSFEDKILSLFKIVYEEFKKIIIGCFMKGNVLDKIINFING